MHSMTRTQFCRPLRIALLFLSVVFSLSLTISSITQAAPGTNEQINFQGRLFNIQGATVPDGSYNIQFKIYQDGTGQSVGNPGGTLLWTESHLNANSQGIEVKNGYLSVDLGSITAFGSNIDWNQSVLWLSMNIGSTNASCTPFSSCTPDGEMVPMKRFSSSPYALNSAQLGGLTSSQFIQLAQGVQTDASTNTSSIHINKTGTGDFLTLQSNGTAALTLSGTGDLLFGSGSNHTISMSDSASSTAGRNLTIGAGSAGAGGTAAAGGTLTLQGGDAAGTGNSNGGDVIIAGGSGTGTGVSGLVNLGPSAYTSVTNTICSANCSIDQANVDGYGTIIVNASTSDITITLPPPTNTSTAGRIVYIATASSSLDYNLAVNSGADAIEVAMRKNTTATMIWNGSAWTPGGASNATTLQATYNNGTNPSTTPEIKLDSIRGTIDIQDADTTIGTDIFNIRASSLSGLGTVLFGVSNSGRVTIQGTTDESSAFRVLNSGGDYLFNINSSNNYVTSNAIRSAGNELYNSNFEAGGLITGGEEGWFGPAQASIIDSSTDAYNGNHYLQVTPNSTNIDVYAGSYHEVREGDELYFEGYVKNSAGANGTAGVQITWYDKDQSVLSYSTDYASLPGTSYVLRSVTGTAPANAQYVRVSATVRSTASTGTYYFDNFYMRLSSIAAHTNFRNSINSATSFRIQSANSAQTLFTANTTDNILKVGDSTGSDTNTTILVLDSTTADPTTSLSIRNGGLFYRSDTNSLKAVIGGAIVDVCTTAVTCSGYSASASSSIQLQASSPGTAQTGHFNITGTGILTQLQTQDRASASTNSSNLTIRTGNATGSTSNSGNLILDVGTATGTLGTITIGHAGVATTMGGTLDIQSSSSLALGTSSSATGSVLFRTAAGANTITLKAPEANPSSSYTITLPQNLGSSGDCLKDTGSGVLGFSDCGAGVTVTLQDVYDNSSPANITLADNKNFSVTAQDTTNDASIIFNLQCTTSCGTNGRFKIQNAGSDILSVLPNGGGIVLNKYTQIGSSTTDTTQVNFQLDSYNSTTDSGTCNSTTNQGAMYYNTTMGSIRACMNGSWADMSNPEALGLMSFGVVPSSGANPYDLTSVVVSGASGPCKVSWASNTSVSIEACVAYSGGRRINVSATTLYTNSATSNNISLTTTERWGHICLTGTNDQPAFTTSAGLASATSGMPTFSINAPILCLASVQGESTTAGRIDNIYDVRTFTSTLKEAVASSTAVELGMITDASGTNGAMIPAVSGSKKLYGLVVATDGSTSTTTPNTIVNTIGPGWVKAIAGTSGDFVKTSSTNGYGDTISSIPNNSFYYSAGNARTSYSTTCTAASNCSGSLYVNYIVR